MFKLIKILFDHWNRIEIIYLQSLECVRIQIMYEDYVVKILKWSMMCYMIIIFVALIKFNIYKFVSCLRTEKVH